MSSYEPRYDAGYARKFLARVLPETVVGSIPRLSPQQVDVVVDKALDYLSFRERETLKLRTGMQGRVHTLEECSQRYKITKGRVRSIEGKGFKKLRGYNIQRELTDLL